MDVDVQIGDSPIPVERHAQDCEALLRVGLI